MYSAANFFPAALRKSSATSVSQVPSACHFDCYPVICLKKPTWDTPITYIIIYDSTQDSKLNRRTT